MAFGIPYDAEVEYLELDGWRIDIPEKCIPVRVGSAGYIYSFTAKALTAGNSNYVLGPDVAVPVLAVHRFADAGGAT